MADYTRRAFLGFTAATAALAGVGASAIAFAGEGGLLRPPGGQDEGALVAACVKCDRCRSACPTNVVGVAHVEDGLLQARTPVLDFHKGYCDFCGKCQTACPTGALGSFDPQRDKLGVAVVQKDRCIAYFEGERVGRCRASGDRCSEVQRLRRVRERVPRARVPFVRGRVSAGRCRGGARALRAFGEDDG